MVKEQQEAVGPCLPLALLGPQLLLQALSHTLLEGSQRLLSTKAPTHSFAKGIVPALTSEEHWSSRQEKPCPGGGGF